MKRPAQRRFHRALAKRARISGWSGQGTAAQPRKKSNQATRHAYSLSTNRCRHNSRLEAEVPRTAENYFFGSPSATARRLSSGAVQKSLGGGPSELHTVCP